MRAGASISILAVVCVTFASPLDAQWYVELGLTATRYGGTARDTSGDPHARPGDAAMIGLRIKRTLGKAHAALRLSYGKPGLSLTGQGLTITDRSTGQLLESGVLLGFQVGGIGSSGAVSAELGPALHLWKIGDELRARVGAFGAIAYEWSVVGRLLGVIRTEGMFSKSWFDADDLGQDYVRRMTWRYGVGLGLAYRL